MYFQEASTEEKEGQTPSIRLNGSASSLIGYTESYSGHLPHTRATVSPVTSPSCSLEFLNSLSHQSLREYFFMGLPMIVHPVIVLRLLSHRLFGNMIRRKPPYSNAKLKPPKVDKVDAYPPRKPEASEKQEAGTTNEHQQPQLSQNLCAALDQAKPHSVENAQQKTQLQHLEQRRVPKPKPCLRVMISDSGIDEDEGHIHDLDEKDFTAGERSATKSFTPHHGHAQSKNGAATKQALRAIGESLLTPIDLDIKSKSKDGATVTCAAAASGDISENVMSDASQRQSTSKKIFRWPSKKRLSKSQANVQVVHQDSVVSGGQPTSGSCSEVSTPEVDIAAFQRELINLPTFVMETPQIELSPIFSRSSSVPENLASRYRTNIINSSTGQLHVHTDVADVRHSPTRPNFIFPNIPIACGSFRAGSMVTITTTDVGGGNERVLHHPLTSVASPVPTGSRSHPQIFIPQTSRSDSVAATTITVHFEAPPSPNPSTSSQSPQTQFEFPNIPPSTIFSNHLSVKQEYPAPVKLSPLQQQPTPYASLSTPVLFSPSAEQRVPVASTPAASAMSPITTPNCEISLQHRGILRVLETWSRICQTDLEGNSLIALETREFLKRLSAMGHEYKAWCQRFGAALRLEVCNSCM